MFSYDATLMVDAILYFQKAKSINTSTKETIQKILPILPPDFKNSNLIYAIYKQLLTIEGKINNFINLLNEIIIKLSILDEKFKKEIDELGISSSPLGLTVMFDYRTEEAKKINFRNNLVKDDYEQIKKKIHELLYGSFVYGGRQEKPYAEYTLYGDKLYRKIVQNYCPDITEEELVDYLDAIKKVGCGYTALANYVIEAYKDKPEQFEKDFGFPIAHKDGFGRIILNTEYLQTDIYCYSQEKQIVNDDVKINKNLENFAYSGNTGNSGGLTIEKTIDILNSDRYKNANINIKIIKDSNENIDCTQIIKDTVNKNGVLYLVADNYDLYGIEPFSNIENARAKNAKVKSFVDAPHAMTIANINKNGDYIVSSWGAKYALDPKSLNSEYRVAVIEFGGKTNE